MKNLKEKTPLHLYRETIKARTKLESDDVFLQKQVFNDDHLENQKTAVDNKLYSYRTRMEDYVGFPQEVKIATIECLLELEATYGFVDISYSLREICVLLSELLTSEERHDETRTGATIYKMRMLLKIAETFDWIRNHGCARNVEPID